MPLLHRKPFVRQKPPPDLDPDEEVFLCKITHEIFRSYDEFFERTILCNSLVWSCALTGRAGLTYLEAVESERKARNNLQNFPQCLLKPLLLLVKQSHSKRLSELCEEVYGFCKDRYFPGENVDVTIRGGNRVLCQVVMVLSPQSSANGLLLSPHSKANGSVHNTEGDSIVISDSDTEDELTQINGKRRKALSPSVFRYTVKPLNGDAEPFTVKAAQLSRRKSVLSREKLKLLFKQHCEPHNGGIIVKSSTVSSFGLSALIFTQFFPDDPPVFSPSKSSPGQGSLSHLKAMEEKLKLMQQKEDMSLMKKNKVKEMKRLKDEERLKQQKKMDKLQQMKEMWRGDKDEEQAKENRKRDREERQQQKLEEKLNKRAEKEREREKLKEERKKYAERIKMMSKPAEDLECEDLQELPLPSPVHTCLPLHLFGDALMVLEFLTSFGEVFDLKDEFPDGVTLEVLEEALVGSDPEGPLCELLFFFLSAIFQSSDEEEQSGKEPDLLEALDDTADPTSSALAAMTTAAGAWSQLHQGRSLKQLDLDSCTLSEILRLKILSAKTRDDPCVEFKNMCPEILQRLRSTAVYDLQPGEKLQILNALVGKLLSLDLSRDLMEDCMDEQKAARQELREIRAEQHRREREEAAYRVRMRKEERLLKMKEREDKLREQENIRMNGTESIMKPEQIQDKDTQKGPDSKPATLSPEELQKEQEKVNELLVRIHRAHTCTSLLPLGRDRWFRKYWLLPSLSALFVEEDAFGLTADMTRPEGGTTEPAHTGVSDSPDSTPIVIDSAPPSPEPGCAPVTYESTPRWWFFSSEEQVEQLLKTLNPRGHRESGLREALSQERARISTGLKDCEPSKFTHTEEQSVPEGKAAESVMEVKLRDLLLDIEDRVYQGTLGALKVERLVWRAALEAGDYSTLIDSCEEQSMEVESSDSFGASSLGVRALATALAEIERGIERRFLKSPLGDDVQKTDAKNKKNQSSDEGSDGGRVGRSLLERWRESLSCCSSLSQVFIHLSSLERSILWSRSLLNARCRICRRKGDADNMLLCDGCDRGHHTHCLRPKLKSIPTGDWFCPDCKPKQRSSRVPSRTRSSVDEEEEEEEESEEEEEESEEEEEEEEAEDSEEEKSEEEPTPTPRSHHTFTNKRCSAPPTKGKNQSTSSKSQQTTPKNFATKATPTSRSGGKKQSPPSTRAPPRAGSRSSSRLSLEVAQNGKTTPKTTVKTTPKTPPKTSKKTSPPSNPRGKQSQPTADPKPKSKPVLASSSGGSRRSSGRNQGVHELSACELLTVELVRHQDSWPFMKLVSRTQVPDYYDIVKRPIALSIIREKVNNCQYQSTAEYMADVELMFSNCLQYNPRSSNEAKAGARLQEYFHSELEKIGLKASIEPPAKRSKH
ncbi:unnamed protein product [Knipowitschia caucasica]